MEYQSVRQLQATIDVLDAALLAQGATFRPAPDPWMLELKPQERALMGALYAAYPRILERDQLLSIVPCKRGEEIDRQSAIVGVLICRCRKVMGFKAIETVRGVGFRMGTELYHSIPKKALDKAA